MSDKVKAFLLGAGEALGAGFLLGVGSVWVQPGDVLFTSAGMLAAAKIGAQVAVIYLFAYLRRNVVFANPPAWDGEERRGLTDAERRAAARLPLAPKDGR